MIIIPDKTKITYLIDSHPDTPRDAEYIEVSECDTIEIDFDEEFLKFCFDERLAGSWGDCNIRDVPEIIEIFIKAKIAEKNRNE